jgi:predicted Zn finger-like uncharacterized protein
LYTRCTECLTVFHITVAELRAADGRVVCGQCDQEFDALENLSDTLPPAEAPEAAAAAGAEPAAPRRETRDEDEFLREIESLIVDETEDGFPGPDEVFRIDPTGGEVRLVISDAQDAPDRAAGERGEGEDETDGATAPEPETLAETGQEGAEEAPGQPEPGKAEEKDTGEPASTAQPEPEPLPLPTEAPAQRRWPRIVLLTLVALVLGGAWAHSERGRLLRHPLGQAVLGPVYGLLGIEANPAWSPGGLRVVRSAAVADPDAPGSLRVTAEFRNSADFGQPYPVLRVTLEDRWGQKVESRDFTPSEYRETHVAGRLMRSGERVQASVSLPDPGARADGFRLDLCLEGPGRQLVCSTE